MFPYLPGRVVFLWPSANRNIATCEPSSTSSAEQILPTCWPTGCTVHVCQERKFATRTAEQDFATCSDNLLPERYFATWAAERDFATWTAERDFVTWSGNLLPERYFATWLAERDFST